MTLRELINVEVDTLTRLALATGVGDENSILNNFTFEQVRIKLEGVKVTGSPRYAIQMHQGEKVAREFLHSRHIVNRYEFNLIWWDGVEVEMKSFQKMFQNFVTKHVSKFCGTNRQLSHIDPSIENICPSCG